MSPSYWERHPDGPFVTLIAVAATYLNPENYDLDSLKELAKREDDEEMQAFRSELRQALAGPGQLPGDELFDSVEYDHGSDEAFLRWLWRELYGDQPSGASIITRLKALPEPFAERLHWQVRIGVWKAAGAGEWGKALDLLLAGLIQSNAPVSPAERDDLAALLEARPVRQPVPGRDQVPPIVAAHRSPWHYLYAARDWSGHARPWTTCRPNEASDSVWSSPVPAVACSTVLATAWRQSLFAASSGSRE